MIPYVYKQEEKGIKPKPAREPEELRYKFKQLKKELKEIKLIEKVFEDSKRTYGYRKIWEALRQNGYEISLYR